MPKPGKEYLGDAVYANVTRFGELELTTENGLRVTNVIVLEDQVLRALEDYLSRARAYVAEERARMVPGHD